MQALVNRYGTFRRGDGHTVKVPPVEDSAKKETRYLKYLRVRGERLPGFWERDLGSARRFRTPHSSLGATACVSSS